MRLAVGLLLMFSGVAWVQAPESVPITSEPSHHLVLQNEYVRVFDVAVAPKATTLVHRHEHDYLFVTLGDSDVLNERAGEKPVRLVLKDGETHFTPGGFAHAAANNLGTPFHNTTIEILQPSSGVKTCTESCSQQIPCAGKPESCPTVQRLITSDQWEVTEVTFPPHGSLGTHTHRGPHLVIPVSELDLLDTTPGREATEITRNPGGVGWVPATTHSVSNNSNNPVRLITLQFKTPAGK